jgi:hypothetical protein
MSVLLYGSVNPEIHIDPDEWAAQCAIAERADQNTVAATVAAQKRREREEEINFVDQKFQGWTE